MQNTASAFIDLTALRHNLSIVRRLCPQSSIMAVVKADAYGHGLIPVAQALEAADGLAVARLQEALQLRKTGLTQRILLLATLLDATDLANCSEQQIDVTAHDERSLTTIVAQAPRTPLRVWLELDSGMHRIGLNPQKFIEADRCLSTLPGILELTHMTHFSSADAFDTKVLDQQMSCFSACRKTTSNVCASLANSAALITAATTQTDWVRPGLMLYGDNPLHARSPLPLRPVMTLRSYVHALREIDAGEPVGYHGRWTSRRPSRIGTVGIGYGDGYPRHARNGTPVWIKGQLVPLVGQVSMDSLTVDLTDCGHVAVGDEVILWGPQLPAATIAEHAGTISYELFTSLTGRVSRVYRTASQ